MIPGNGRIIPTSLPTDRFTWVLEEVSELVPSEKARSEWVEAFIAELGKQDGLIAEFDERLWYSLVGYAKVYSENDVRFTCKDGTE